MTRSLFSARAADTFTRALNGEITQFLASRRNSTNPASSNSASAL